jgi:hypothetical protein
VRRVIIVQRYLFRVIVYVDGGDNDVSDGDVWLCDEGQRRDEIA